jgi:predicted nucleic acid-binding protein
MLHTKVSQRSKYDVICIPASALAELHAHGAGAEIEAWIAAGFVSRQALTPAERQTAQAIAQEIALSPTSRAKDPAQHYPEAEAIALMGRANLGAVELLLDELAARETAQHREVALVGFPGLLVRAWQQGLLTPDQVRDALTECQRQGTHYSTQLIAEIDQRLRRD